MRNSLRRLAIEPLEGRNLLDGSGALGKLMVQLKDGATLPADHWGLTSNTVQAVPLANWYQVTGPDLPADVQRLQADPRVAWAGLSAPVSATAISNDPSYLDGTLWNLNGPGGVNAPAAWDVNTGSTHVAVGICDSGLDVAHPDLYKNVWLNQAEIPASVKSAIMALANWDVDGDGLITFWDLNDVRNQGPGKITDLDADGRITAKDILMPTAQGGWSNGVSDDGDSYVDDLIGWNFVANNNQPFDDFYHGTAVTGVIGATGNNGVGIVGVNWKTQLMPLKMLNASGEGFDSDGALAILYAANHGARVSSHSWAAEGQSYLIGEAITAALAKNHLVVAGVANAGISTDILPVTPASLPNDNIIAVGGTDHSGNLVSFSNFGAISVDLGAPAIDILSTIPGGGYQLFEGTSMSTPHVAGVAALILAQAPSLSALQVKDLILSRVTPNATLAGKSTSGGVLNLGGIFTGGPEIEIAEGGVNLGDNTGRVDFGTSFIGAPTSRTLTVSNVGIVPLNLGTLTLPNGFTLVSGLSATLLNPGQSATFVVRMAAVAKGTFSGQLTLASNDADESIYHVTLTGVVGNRAPVIGPLANASMPNTQNVFTTAVSATDPDGDAVTLAATAVSQPYYYKQLFGLFTTSDLHLNFAGQQDKWLYGNDATAYFILPSGDFYRYTGPGVGDGTFIANLGTAVYLDPSLLYDAAFVSAPAAVAGGTLTVDPAANFVGNLVVTVTASDGASSSAKTMTLTVTNAPPAIGAIANQTMAPSQKYLTVGYSVSDPEGQPVTVSASVQTEAYSLKQQYGLFFNGSPFTNRFGQQEKWLFGNDGAAFFLLPSGQFFKWSGANGQATGTLLTTLDPKYYKDLSLLYNAVNDGGRVEVANGQVIVSHSAKYQGRLIVTLTASDGLATATRSFTVTVTNGTSNMASQATPAFTISGESVPRIIEDRSLQQFYARLYGRFVR
jgi:subtilisin family serine protease